LNNHMLPIEDVNRYWRMSRGGQGTGRFGSLLLMHYNRAGRARGR
jgi:hypothetical protein